MLRKENEGSKEGRGTFHAIVSKKKKEGSKITFTFTKCFRLFTQHLSSSLCHSSGTKELARQTMLLREKKENDRKRREETEKQKERKNKK